MQPQFKVNLKPQTPEHLSEDAREMWDKFVTEFDLCDTPGQAILRNALEAWDRAQAAREAIDSDGMTVRGSDGQLKVHPLITTERDSRAAFLSGLKALRLDIEPKKSVGRPAGKGF